MRQREKGERRKEKGSEQWKESEMREREMKGERKNWKSGKR